jgi:transcriptional regulator with XRE-family HTH domain
MAKKVEQTLGDRLQVLRKTAGFTQSEFARKIDISHTQVTRYEKGTLPPADVLDRMAAVYGVSIDYIVRGDKDNYVNTTLNDVELVNQYKEIATLPKDEKNVVLKFIGAYIRDFKTKQAYSK